MRTIKLKNTPTVAANTDTQVGLGNASRYLPCVLTSWFARIAIAGCAYALAKGAIFSCVSLICNAPLKRAAGQYAPNSK